MRDKLIEIIENGERTVLGHTIRGTSYYTEALADYLIANNVFVLPEKMKDSWELALPFMVRLFVSDEAEIEKIKGEFEFSQKKKILTDIRDYLLIGKSVFEKTTDFNSVLFGAGVQVFIDQALSDLTEYAEKLGVEL
ncbi:MAG: hypothetical protein IKB02_05730 [Clostridia bacterium]|nr:hypothetical protein [Clostridia bacterium]